MCSTKKKILCDIFDGSFSHNALIVEFIVEYVLCGLLRLLPLDF